MARVVAPIAFFAAAAFLVLLIRDSFSDDGKDGAVEIQVTDDSGETVVVTTTFTVTERAPTESPPESQPATDTAPTKQIPRVYRVKEGDTLESIATRFDVPVATLHAFRPDGSECTLMDRTNVIRTAWTPVGDGVSCGERQLRLAIASGDELANRRLLLRVELVDRDGRAATDEKHVLAQPPNR